MEQVSVETLNYSAELGNVAGAVVNMVLKSGTNQFCGNAFEYWRDNRLAATPWNTNRLGGRKSEFSRNIFGGTFGSPLLLNKVFFFADYQGGRDNTPPTDAFTTVVPDEWRRGDLSDLLARGLVIRDPITGQPFPNNQIPVSRFSAFEGFPARGHLDPHVRGQRGEQDPKTLGPSQAFVEGRKKGILFDVGHGAGSFLWRVAVPLTKAGFFPDTISSDLHTHSMNAGLKDMTNLMSKFLALGMTVEQVVTANTLNAAKAIKQEHLGNLSVGSGADVAVLRVEKGTFGFLDQDGALHHHQAVQLVCLGQS